MAARIEKTARRVSGRNTESIDDYLKAIYSLSGDERRRVGGTELAKRIQVAPASVTNMLQRLVGQTEPLIDYVRGKGAVLTELGHRRALEIVRHHRLVETFLFHMLGYPLTELHDEAERLEHFISEKFEARIADKLGDPTRDPHGHCIPRLDGTMPAGHGLECRCGL